MAARGASEKLERGDHVVLDLVDGDVQAAGDAAVGQTVEADHHENLAGEIGHGDERGFHAGEPGGIDRLGRFGDTGGANP